MLKKILMPAVILLSLLTATFVSAEMAADFFREPEMSCSAVYVGREVSANGTTIIARCADTHPTTSFAYLKINDADNEPGHIVTGENGFSYKLPDKTYSYVSVPFQPVLEYGSAFD